jgi:hypothetical protein
MKRRLIYLAVFALLPLSAYNQEVKNYVYTVGVFGGIDNNINGYRLIPNYYGNNFSASGITSWNFGFDYGYMLTNKLRPRIEAKYLQMRYYADWKDANLAALKESTVFLFSGNVNLRLDYLLLNSPKFQMFVSPALKWEFVIDREVKNYRLDGTHGWDNYNDIIDENPSSIMGASVAALFKYNITKKVSLTLSPEYTYFFREFVRVNDKAYQRTSIRAGIEINFY